MELDPAVDWLTPFADGWARGLATAIRVLVGAALVSGAVLLMVISFTTLTLALGSPLVRQAVRIGRSRVRRSA